MEVNTVGGGLVVGRHPPRLFYFNPVTRFVTGGSVETDGYRWDPVVTGPIGLVLKD